MSESDGSKITSERQIAPTPWSVDIAGMHHVIDIEGHSIAIVDTLVNDNLATAHLLAAAPDLQSALVECLSFMKFFVLVYPRDSREYLAAINQAERALAKASGRS